MIRVLPIFDLFRHGRAERAFQIAPVVFVNSSDELCYSEHRRQSAPVRASWTLAKGEGNRLSLKLSWTTAEEERGRS